jgi:cyclic beta-1,2-glucan synthetase
VSVATPEHPASTSDGSRVSSGHPSPPPHEPQTCAGLDPAASWDAAEHLRGELFTIERLEEHAADLARVHGSVSKEAQRGALRERFVEARANIERAYGLLMKGPSRRREMSPAEEWLVDNSHIVDDQVREIEEDLPAGYLAKLPRLGHGAIDNPMRGFPRVYAIAVDYLRHTDARVELDSLSRYVHSYQTVAPLTIGELWAIPIMLRLGLLLNIAALAESEVSALERARGDEWASKILSAKTGKHVERALASLEDQDYRPTVAFLVHLLRRLREHDTHTQAAFEWVEAECLKHGHGPEELTRRHHLKQAADQLSVGNTITSMRQIGALDWNTFFERASQVEAILRKDPAGAYSRTDAETRDRYRHAVEDLARRSDLDERGVAMRVVELAGAVTDPADHRRHVGEWLVGRARRELEADVHYRAPAGAWARTRLLDHPNVFYFGALVLVTAGVVAAAIAIARPASPLGIFLVCLLAFVPATEIASSLVNAIVTTILPPRVLPKLDLDKGVPPELRTLVVVPALVTDPNATRQLVSDLEKRYLGNTDAALDFGLLTDFADHAIDDRPDDADRLAEAVAGIAALNEKYARGERARFFLLHRRRQPNPRQGCSMGYERKRGKLDALNRLVAGEAEASFDTMTVERGWFDGVRYIITLDADTELPREAARRLIATIAHPTNWPVHDPETGLVTQGHAIVQPRTSSAPQNRRASRFARAHAGQSGIDPYTTAISDVYQDLFGEGSFVGKAIYDPRACVRALGGRVPDDTLLSHDLFEGLFARAALATDIELFDAEPATYAVAAKRQHRWIRGDWQLLPWVAGKIPHGRDRSPNPIPLLGRWKMIDNLRRSVLPIALVVLLATSVAGGVRSVLLAALLLLAVQLVPLALRLLVELARPRHPSSRPRARDLFGDLATNASQLALGLTFLLDRAVIAVDAIARTLFRLYVSRRNLLEWQTMQDASAAARARAGLQPRLVAEALVSTLLLIPLAITMPITLVAVAPFLALFASAPFVARWVSLPLPARDRADIAASLDAEDRRGLRLLARRTWDFFETFVTAGENWLPPDNFQSQPRGVIAHRTSPTNIGLYMLSTGAGGGGGGAGRLLRCLTRTVL